VAECTVCHGWGEITWEDKPKHFKSVECSNCKGTGEVDDKRAGK